MSQPLCLLGASVCVGILKDGFTIHAVRIIDKRGITRRLYLFQLIKRKRSLENVAFLFFSWMKKNKERRWKKRRKYEMGTEKRNMTKWVDLPKIPNFHEHDKRKIYSSLAYTQHIRTHGITDAHVTTPHYNTHIQSKIFFCLKRYRVHPNELLFPLEQMGMRAEALPPPSTPSMYSNS